jgi:hypothetical protein
VPRYVRFVAPLAVALALVAGLTAGTESHERPRTTQIAAVAQTADAPPRDVLEPAMRRSEAIERYESVMTWLSVATWNYALAIRWASASARASAKLAARRASVTHATTSSTSSHQVAPPAVRSPAPTGGSTSWDRLAACESSGNWADTDGMFEGGLQFSNETWLAYGGGAYAQHAYEASRDQQIAIAEKVLRAAGGRYTDWPGCRAHLGLA